MLSAPHLNTLFSMLFMQHITSISRKRGAIRLLIAFKLAQSYSSRKVLFLFFCLLKRSSSFYLSLEYYFLKLLKAFIKGLLFFTDNHRRIFLRLEALLASAPIAFFTFDWFCYDKAVFTPPLILAFNRYLLRLDMYSLFFVWSGIEHIRISLYNSYIRVHPELWERPFLREAFIQTWFPRRKAYVKLRGLTLLNLREFDYRGIRQVLSDRFAIMFHHKKYTIIMLLKSSYYYFRDLNLSLDLKAMLRNDTTLYWLSSLANKAFIFSSEGFFRRWIWPQLWRLFFIFFMQHPKRYHLDKWRIKRYFMYLGWAMAIAEKTAEIFVSRSTRDYSSRVHRNFYRQMFCSEILQRTFFLRDLYTYSFFSWENLISFIDRHFCYRVFSMKFNWFFDYYFLEQHSRYMALTLHFQRPFQRKSTPEHSIPRRRALFFAKRFLLRFCKLPIHFSYLLLGLEYYYWRIHELDAHDRWTQNLLPTAYYYTKLDIDRLLICRYRVMVNSLRSHINAKSDSLCMDSFFEYLHSNPSIFQSKHWAIVQHTNFFSPWLLFHFSALKSIFLQSSNNNFQLALLSFFLIGYTWTAFVNQDLQNLLHRRFWHCFNNVELFNRHMLIDSFVLVHLGVAWTAPRAKKWLSPFDEKNTASITIESRYGSNYQWLLKNKQSQYDD